MEPQSALSFQLGSSSSCPCKEVLLIRVFGWGNALSPRGGDQLERYAPEHVGCCLKEDKSKANLSAEMVCKQPLQHLLPDYATEIELRVVEQELHASPTMIQIPLTPPEPVRAIQFSPISFLPNEILIDIFTHALLVERPHSATSLPFQHVVGGVCNAWRGVILQTPELWTRAFITSAMPADHLQTYVEKSKGFKFDAHMCHWPAPECANEINSSEAFLDSIIGVLRGHVHRLRSLALWDVSDTAVCTLMSCLRNTSAPCLESVSVKANPTAHTFFYQLRNLYLLPFLAGSAPELTHLEIDHFPIETFRMRSDWRFDVPNLTSLTLRTNECSLMGYQLPPYLIEFPALCALLRSTPNLTYLALYGPVIEPDEDFPVRPPGAALPALTTLIIHRREPGVRYYCELLNVITAPRLTHLEIPFHDELSVELPYADRTAGYLFDGEGNPRFGGVRRLRLHDSAVKWVLPTRSYVRAFPDVEEVVLGGTDVPRFAATLRGFVVSEHGSEHGALAPGAWAGVRKVVLREVDMGAWKGCVRGFCKWLAARGHEGGVTIQIEVRGNGQPGVQEGWYDDKALMRSIQRLRKYAQVEFTDSVDA
ncbi:hypothetical protein HYDPIDRAFT_30094 [Hydnomerulius pinastri MD-312]|uniref:F-box domain-containing protein n=1 Tax=Hydnomerulius pinastri MD-312 TaxID=994086 RepID=A0A0C9VXJ0_9AGAM|nr:hypothetical protein HYDPIDRAFT_30094 [Hydnomerulius pinastri MD-312]